MGHPVAVLDADVLVPVMVCDLLLSLFGAELFQPVVSPTILVEIERNLIADFPHINPQALRSRVDQMRQALALHVFAVSDVESEAIIGVNRKDRHVAALALERRADLIVSNDRRLRREIGALNRPLGAVSADEFALRLLIGNPQAVGAVLDALVAKRIRRPITLRTLIDQLARPLPHFAAELRKRP